MKRRRLLIEVHEDKAVPGRDLNRRQSILGTVKVTNPGKLRGALERTIQPVSPPVVRAAQMLSNSGWRRRNGSRVMAANVIESPQLLISPANHDERLTCQVKGEKLPGIGRLICASHSDPIGAEYLLAFQACDTLIDIPGCRKSVSVLKRRLLIVERQHVGKGIAHSATSPARAARLIERCPRRYTAMPASSTTKVMAIILNSATPGLYSCSPGNAERMMAAVVEKKPTQAKGIATRFPPGR